MKKWKRILSATLSVLLLSGNISLYAAEHLSCQHETYTDRSEVIGTAVVVGDEEGLQVEVLFFPDRNNCYDYSGKATFLW